MDLLPFWYAGYRVGRGGSVVKGGLDTANATAAVYPWTKLLIATFTAGIEGLFLVGAGTLGGGIMACVQSGVLVGKKVESLL